jgi:HptB-dependent secretion and biofilm anti anti-sigma factor
MTDITEIKLPATFDYSYHKYFIDEYTALLEKGVLQLVLDFNRVDYLDSSALGMLVMLNKRAEVKHANVKIKGARGATLEILQMANMQKMFQFV